MMLSFLVSCVTVKPTGYFDNIITKSKGIALKVTLVTHIGGPCQGIKKNFFDFIIGKFIEEEK